MAGQQPKHVENEGFAKQQRRDTTKKTVHSIEIVRSTKEIAVMNGLPLYFEITWILVDSLRL